MMASCLVIFFFFNDTATTEIYTLSLHDALPILPFQAQVIDLGKDNNPARKLQIAEMAIKGLYVDKVDEQKLVEDRSEEHTSELQSRQYLVCRLLLEKKTKT